MNINNLPNEIICIILEHCNNFQDYFNWNLVCKLWNILMKDANRVILFHKLNEDIINMIPNRNSNYDFFYIKNESYLDPKRRYILTKCNFFKSFFFISWGPKIIIQDKIELYADNKFIGVTIKDCLTTYPYYYASKMPKNNCGYICVPSVNSSINKIIINFGHEFCPILIATN